MIGNDQIDGPAGADVYSYDGDHIGRAGEVHLDYRTGRTEWVSVRTGRFGLKECFVPLSQATASPGRVEVPFTKDRVKSAPSVEVHGDLDQNEVDKLSAHYGLTAADGHPSR
jgi:sporulation protein YlmC with PRC-barrel domain